jgi:general secretion pathway protein I
MTQRCGFSLIEMLVALSVLSVAGLALLNATHQASRGAQMIEARSLAALAAENVMNAELIEQAGGRLTSDRGRYSLAGREYDWTLTVLPTTDAGLVRVELAVEETGGGGAHSILTFRRAG